MTKVRTEIEIREIDGKELDRNAKTRPALVIESHWAPPKGMDVLVVLTVGDKTYSVAASQLTAGVENATNRG